MPLYEYECRDCQNRFEVRQRIVEDPISVCPSCGGACRRLIHPVGIVFKGSGFYVTDNRKGEESATSSSAAKTDGAAKSEGTAKPEGATKSETTSSEKASTTTESKPSAPAAT